MATADATCPLFAIPKFASKYRIGLNKTTLSAMRHLRDCCFCFGREDKPCFDRGDDLSLGSVFLDIDGPVCLLLPDGGLVGLVHDQELDVDVGAQLGVAPVRGTDADPITGSLYT